MDYSDVVSSTPRLLKTCVDLTSLPSPRTVAVSSEKFKDHPTIQYFRNIKSKHHFAYHKAKRSNLESILANMSVFDPYSRELLLERLATFNVLNWLVPEVGIDLSELKCARNGWKCTSISANNNTKNHLICTQCHAQTILKFHTLDASLPFEFDLDDYNELNAALKAQYAEVVEKSGHRPECLWVNFETPAEGVYYLRPHLKQTNESLINDYLKNLMNLVDNSQVLMERANLQDLVRINGRIPDNNDEFVRVLNLWLLNRYFADNKENFSLMLDFTPRWYYSVALYGWDIHIQSFSDTLVLLLICTKCNKRIFLNTSPHSPVNRNDPYGVSPSTNIAVSASKILTPCRFPPSVPNDPEEEDEIFDLAADHKPWCCNRTGHADELHLYFVQMLISSEEYIGNAGDFDYSEMLVDLSDAPVKRRVSFDVNDGLDRLTKLRKLYLLDEH